MARQLVNHGHVEVDGRTVRIGSFLVNRGQKIELKPAGHAIPDVQEEIASRGPTVSWLRRANGRGEVVDLPHRNEIEFDIDELLIVAFYSR